MSMSVAFSDAYDVATRPAYVTEAELAALLAMPADDPRVLLAVAATNEAIVAWSPVDIDTVDDAGNVTPALDPPITPARRQAGLQLAHLLYREHAAVGGIFDTVELVARLPADVVRGIRDMLDVDTHWWGVA